MTKMDIAAFSEFNTEFNTDKYKDVPIILKCKDETKTWSLKTLDISVKWKNQEEFISKYFVDLDKEEYTYHFGDHFEDKLETLNETRKDWISAEIQQTDTSFILIDEVIGDKIDIQRLSNDIKKNLASRGLEIDLEQYTVEAPENHITTKSIENQVKYWDMFKIEYNNGFIIRNTDIRPYFSTNENKTEIVFRQDLEEDLRKQIKTWVETTKINEYNTLGGVFKFKTHAGNIVEVPGINHGDKIDVQRESEELFQSIINLWPSPKRVPYMSIDMEDDIQTNVIEISIQDQHLWVWRDGEIEIETDVVTGTKNRYDTPPGVYGILNVIDGCYLEGADYKTWVDKWMRIWRGYGLHDAKWRRVFGGSIYETSGSHGCINMPHDVAVRVFELVKPRDLVVIY